MSGSTPAAVRYRGLVQTLPTVAIVLDREGRFVDYLVNEYNEELYYADPADLIGRTLGDVLPRAMADRFDDAIRRSLETGAVETLTYELTVQGEPRRFEAYVSPLPGEEPPKVLWVAEDVTGQTVRAAAPPDTPSHGVDRQGTVGGVDTRLAWIEQLATVGGWALDLRTDTLRWTAGTRRIHEVDDEFEPSLESALAFYHEEDRRTLRAAVERCVETGEPYDVEVRLTTARGRERWVEATGVAIREAGDVVRVEGAIRDITGQKQREQQLAVMYRILRHNLRNELNVIRGFTELIERELTVPAGTDPVVGPSDAPGPAGHPTDLDADLDELSRTITALSTASVADLRERATRIRSATDRLLSIGEKVSHLQDLTAATASRELSCDLRTTVDAAVERSRAEHPGAEINVSPVDRCRVAAEAQLVAIALGELVENAIVHAESPVSVRTETTAAGSVSIEVADGGPGIPEYELEALRGGPEGALLHSSGLGLWLVNWIVTRLDGALRIETDAGDGTVAALVLPTATPVDAEDTG